MFEKVKHRSFQRFFLTRKWKQGHWQVPKFTSACRKHSRWLWHLWGRRSQGPACSGSRGLPHGPWLTLSLPGPSLIKSEAPLSMTYHSYTYILSLAYHSFSENVLVKNETLNNLYLTLLVRFCKICCCNIFMTCQIFILNTGFLCLNTFRNCLEMTFSNWTRGLFVVRRDCKLV